MVRIRKQPFEIGSSTLMSKETANCGQGRFGEELEDYTRIFRGSLGMGKNLARVDKGLHSLVQSQPQKVVEDKAVDLLRSRVTC